MAYSLYLFHFCVLFCNQFLELRFCMYKNKQFCVAILYILFVFDYNNSEEVQHTGGVRP